MAATLKQVAESVGVSYQTVWRAVHDAPGILPETRQSILEAAARLGYTRNAIAGSLRTNRSSTIGLVMLDVRNSHAGEITLGVEEAAANHGYSVLLANTVDVIQREQNSIISLLERRVDGIILSPTSEGDHGYLKSVLPNDFPFVAINRNPGDFPCHTILSRDSDVTLAARELVANGHENIAGIFGDITIAPFHGRHEAFLSELQALGRAPADIIVSVNKNDAGAARSAVHRLFSASRPPTGLFAASSRLTEGALQGLRDCNIRHGTDVQLIGFDLRYANLLDPPLPVLMQPAREMGHLAVDVIVRLLKKSPIDPPKVLPLRFSGAGDEKAQQP